MRHNEQRFRSIRCGIWRPVRLGKQGSVLSRYTSVGQGLRRRHQWPVARGGQWRASAKKFVLTRIVSARKFLLTRIVLSRYTSVGQGLRRRDQWTTARQCLRPRRDDHSSGRCQSLLSSLAAAARGPRTSPPRRRVLQPCPRLLTTAKPCGNFAGACRRGRRRHCVQRLTLMGGRRKNPSHADLVHGNSLLRWIRMRQRIPEPPDVASDPQLRKVWVLIQRCEQIKQRIHKLILGTLPKQSLPLL